MKSSRLIAIVAVLSALCSAPASADSFSIMARAATICRVDFAGSAPSTLEAGETPLGRMTELCNSADGYRLVLRHPAGLEDAWLLLDGQKIALSPLTETVITDTSLPGFKQRTIAIALADDEDIGGFSFSAQPKGAIY